MKKISSLSLASSADHRRGSTLVIVIALLGLLAFMGMVFYTFAAQERASAEYFSEAAKAEVDEPPNVFDHMLRHVISGPGNRPSERGSILRSPDRHHSLVSSLVGSDITPHNGDAIRVIYDSGTGRPIVDQNFDGTADGVDWLDMVDSPAARFGNENRGVARPAPDVDFTYPDINNPWLAYRGWAIRDNGAGVPPGSPRYERVPVIIPSYFRPQYMKFSNSNAFGGQNVLTDFDWAVDASDRTTRTSTDRDYSRRSFRPHALHIAGFGADGTTPVYRYLNDVEAAAFGIASGGFPFLPEDDTNSGNGTTVRGELGIWTGSHPGVYELDADNDGDGINEGIWMDLHFPMQEYTDGGGNVIKYVVLHSVTIYDLDSLIDLNVHGNLAGLDRNANFRTLASAASGPGNVLENRFLSRSNLGLGPNEINPLWALRTAVPAVGDPRFVQFLGHYTATPNNDLEQANMELLWLLTGRGDYDTSGVISDILPGRWGEADRLYNAINGSALVANLPRPGRADNAGASVSSGIRYGGNLTTAGRNGFDDNQDAREGEATGINGRLKAFGTPMDYAGTGRSHNGLVTGYDQATQRFNISGTSDPRLPILHHDTGSAGPERWLGFNGYSITRDVVTTVNRYMFGQNGIFDNASGDDLISNPFFDALFEDPLETIFDSELALNTFDQIFTPEDVPSLQISTSDFASIASGAVATRMNELSPVALAQANADVRERFTTLSNSLRKFMYKHHLGADMRLGTADDGPRAWESNADSDGADTNNDGLPDGDGFLEFPPVFGAPGSNPPFSATDPFRPQVRRLLTAEIGENRRSPGQLPLSINHILDVERNTQTPPENSPQFLQYMQRAGLRFRPLTDHPDASEGNTVLNETVLPTWTTTTPVAFPPQTVGDREFWARRDRQKLARDIFVLLYTTGGAQLADRANAADFRIKDYTQVNDPNAAEGLSLYTHQQLRQMAQLAVNLVAAMDADNVVTRFEYDKNLGDGWNLDDDSITDDGFVALGPGDAGYAAATANGMYADDSLERGVVYGVEAQQLAFSEVHGIRSPEITADDHEATPYDDQTGIRDFCSIELQNMSPMAVDLATSVTSTAATAVWRLSRYDRAGNTDPLQTALLPDRAIAFMSHVDNVIDGGGRFSVGAASDTSLATSAFFLDVGNVGTGNFDGTYELISPDANLATLPTSINQSGSGDPAYATPLFDLDLVHANHNMPANSRFIEVGGPFMDAIQNYGGNEAFGGTVDQYNGNFDPSVANGGFDLVIQRRMNPNLPSLNETDNPWIEVDRIRVLLRNFNLADGDTPGQIFDPSGPSGHVTDIQSEERSEPLSDRTRQLSAASASQPYRFNSIKGDIAAADNDMLGVNVSKIGGQFNLWQVHFDRDYASPAELLNLPIVGPNLLTQRLERMRFPAFQQAFPDPNNTASGSDPQLISSAEAMFLGANFPDQVPTPLPEEDARDNRWYRMLQFVEVPSRVHRMLGNYLSLERLPGKLNLNTMRHMEVFAGLIDSPLFANTDGDATTVPFLRDFTHLNAGADLTPTKVHWSGNLSGDDVLNVVGGAQIQDRWMEYLIERDGVTSTYDPIGGQLSAAFIIPGTPNSNPFRSLSHSLNLRGDNALNQTLLRSMASDRFDSDLTTNRQWLEVGGHNRHRQPDLRSSSMQRHQILSKVMNNTTTVSNTFVLFSTAAYFEAYDGDPSGLIRVGGRLDLDGDGDATNDQQRAMFILDRTEAFRAFDAGTGDFDWRRLVKVRTTIE